MESSTVRIRPLRLAFLVKPADKASLKRVFEINSGMWGGIYNFIIPFIVKLPKIYYEQYVKKQPPAAAGREYIKSRYQKNPVIILTGKELFGQFKLGDFYGEYGTNESWVRGLFEDVDLAALGDFTQGLYLDMKPVHEVLRAKHIKKAQKKAAKQKKQM